MKIKTLVLLFLLLAMSVSSWGYSFVYNGIYYNILSGNTSVEVTYRNGSYNSYSGSVTIPSSIYYSGKAYSVTSIGNYAFRQCTDLTSVTIPNSVTQIGVDAFRNCSRLSNINIPGSVTSIGQTAFYGCTSFTSVTVPNSVSYIGTYAFRNCTGITNPVYNDSMFIYMPTSFSGSYSIPSGIKRIANTAFYGCTGLTCVTIPNSVTDIESRVFYDCTSLSMITIPSSVTHIGSYAFRCTALTNVTVPNSVVSIGINAFFGCANLLDVTISSSIKTIGEGTFSGCSSLTTVIIPSSVKTIGLNAFADCTSLTSVYFKRANPPSFTSGFSSDFPSSVTSCYVPCGKTSAYRSSIGNSIHIYEDFTYSFSATSANNSLGTVSITRQPSCTQSAVIQATVTASHYHFARWSDGNTSNPRNVTVSCDTSLSAIFELDKYTVTGTGTNGSVSGGGSCDYGSTTTLTATGDTHYHFARWSDGNTSNPRTVTVTGNKTYTAIFEPDKYTVTGTGTNGSVSGGGSCDYGSTTTLTATGDTHYHFARWSDGNTSNPRTVTVTGNKTYTAIFEPDKYTVTGTGTNGSVSGGGLCDYGSTTTLTATGDTHYHFARWSDGNTSNPRTVTVTGNKTYTAIFEPDKYTVTGTGTNGSVSGGGSYDYGSTATLSAIGDEYYHFAKWSDGNTSNPRIVTVTDNTTYIAVFAGDEFSIVATCQHGTVIGSGTYVYPDVVTLTVTPDEGYRFVKWSDDNEYNPRIFVARNDLTVEAICEEAPVIDDVEDVQADAPAFYVVGTTVFNPSNEQLRVYSAAGKLLKSADTDIDLFGYPAGIYIVTDSRGNSVKMAIH